MVSNLQHTESEIRTLYARESELAEQKLAAVEKTFKDKAKAGEHFLVGGPKTMRNAVARIARSASAADILEASISAARLRRFAAVKKYIAAQLVAAREPLRALENELGDVSKKRARLLAQLTKLEGSAVLPYPNAAARSSSLALRVEAAQRSIVDLESRTPQTSGEIDASTVDDLVARATELVTSVLVPSEFDLRAWATAVEARVAADRPRLLAERKTLLSRTVSSGDLDGTPCAVDGGSRMERYRRVYCVVFNAGVITDDSTLAFLGTNDGDVPKGNPTYSRDRGCLSRHSEGWER